MIKSLIKNFTLYLVIVLFRRSIFLGYDVLLFFCRFAPSLNHRRALMRHAVSSDFHLFLKMSWGEKWMDCLLVGGKLTYLIVGARGDEQDDLVRRYAKHFQMILCEPEKTEALRLESLGFKVANQPLYSTSKTMPFFICRDASKSSLYRTDGPFTDFYNPDPSYMTLWEVVAQEDMECSTVHDSLHELGVSQLDMIKMDVQGAELDILQGMGDYRPLILIVEVQYLPMYAEMPTGFALLNYLYQMGYIPLQMGPNFNSAVAPSVGDVIFMPNWTDSRGRDMILQREREYISLMCIFDQIDVLRFVSKKIEMKNRNLIEEIFKDSRRQIFS